MGSPNCDTNYGHRSKRCPTVPLRSQIIEAPYSMLLCTNVTSSKRLALSITAEQLKHFATSPNAMLRSEEDQYSSQKLFSGRAGELDGRLELRKWWSLAKVWYLCASVTPKRQALEKAALFIFVSLWFELVFDFNLKLNNISSKLNNQNCSSWRSKGSLVARWKYGYSIIHNWAQPVSSIR